MEQKQIASEIFKDKKDNYPQSVPKLFVNTRLSKTQTFCTTTTNKTWNFYRFHVVNYGKDSNSMFTLVQMGRT